MAVLGVWAVIPLYALPFGAPTYLTFGGALFYLSLREGFDKKGDLALAGFSAHVLSLPVVYLVCRFLLDEEFFAVIAIFGIPMAPLWGLMFGALYRGLRDD